LHNGHNGENEQEEKSLKRNSSNSGSSISSNNYGKILHDIALKQASKRRIINKTVSILAIVSLVAAIIPLGSILIEVVKNGAYVISIDFLVQRPESIGSSSGGIGPAIQGTLIVVGLASVIGAPIGILAGVYLSEYASVSIGKTGEKGRGRATARLAFASSIRLLNDVLTGLPSIVIGIVGYVTLVLAIGSFSVWAGAFALSIIMIPIVSRVTEETLKLVPNSIREAGHSLGIPKWKITIAIVLKSAKTGVLTGIVLAISRIAGETAPLIMTILGTSLYFTSLTGPVDALPLRIWRLASQPYESAHAFGWGAALVLILIVLGLSVSLRLLVHRKGIRFRSSTIPAAARST
jgi:phosphate transport system permease protein